MSSSAATVIVILLMGVAGSGKTTIGTLLADSLGWQFADADDFHAAENIAKMQQGIPLTDADRAPWLLALQTAIEHWLAGSTPTVLACSALKQVYRQVLIPNPEQVRLVYLKGNAELLQQRLQQRQGHYMQPILLESQFATLEEPTEALTLSIDQHPRAIVEAIRAGLGV